MENNRILRLIYTVFLGLLIAAFIGVGINTFYKAPEAPAYPTTLNTYGKELTPMQVEQQQQFDRRMDQYNHKMEPYNRNVSIIALSASVILLIVSLVYQRTIRIIADGTLLGGLFTLFYSIGRGFASNNSSYTFIVVTMGLVITLSIGYQRFVQSDHHDHR